MKNSFTVNYAANLWLAALGIKGLAATGGAFVVTLILGSMLDRGIIVLDIQIDKLREALKDSQWRAAAQKAYDKASARVYTEKEKDEIRRQYLDALSKYGSFGVSKY